MARLYTCGFELQSPTAGIEFTAKQDASSLCTIDAATKRSGAASLHVGAGAQATVEQQIVAANTDGPFYTRFYVRFINQFPTGGSDILYLASSDGSQKLTVAVKETGELRMWTSYWTGLTTISAPLSLGKWYRVEARFRYDSGNGTSECEFGYALEDQPLTIVSSTLDSYYAAGITYVRIGNSSGAANFDANFDDWAINDSTGSYQNSYPGPGHVVHFKPTGAGDSNTWQKSGGGAGDANNYNQVYETTPDNASTYLKRIATTIKVDDYNVTNPADAGIGSTNINVNAIQVGIRGGAISGTASTARDVRLRIKKAASGTVGKTATSVNRLNINGWTTHTTVAPKLYKACISGSYDCTYVDPDGAAWNYGTLTSMQIGCENQTSSTTEVRMSTLWAAVDYVAHDVHAKANIQPLGKWYSKGNAVSLPTGDTNLETIFNQTEYDNVVSENATRSDQAVNEYGLFLFKDQKGAGDTNTISIEWNGQSAIAPSSSTVYLQIYNRNSTTWETLDSESGEAADTDFTLSGTVGGIISNYLDANNFIACRVYQGDID
jgi:hypothetical protein